jgi:hypothetical protein
MRMRKAERVRPGYLRPEVLRADERIRRERLELLRDGEDEGGNRSICARGRGSSVGRPPPGGGQTYLQIQDVAGLSVTEETAHSSYAESSERDDESWWGTGCDGPRRRAEARLRSQRSCGRRCPRTRRDPRLRVRVSVRLRATEDEAGGGKGKARGRGWENKRVERVAHLCGRLTRKELNVGRGTCSARRPRA